nr:MerR family transcriptional regulator [Actinomyces faecalis]
MKIGEVVDQLRASFPALSISKVRYLESEGLIHPHRVGNGYRQYSKADVERLRFTLAAQRDEYLPLSVIRERLEQLDRQPASGGRIARVVASHGRLVDEDGPLDLTELMRRSGASEEQVDELIAIGVITADARGTFRPTAVRAAELAMRIHRLGLPLRNLRAIRTAAEREADLIDHVVQHQRPRSAQAAEQTATTLAASVAGLHEELLRRTVESLG